MTDSAQVLVTERRKGREKLPRGIRYRGTSFVAYLTHPDGRAERRTIGNVTLKMAAEQRAHWQREITEGRYIKKVPRVEHVAFGEIARTALEHANKYKRSWDTDAGRIRRMLEWWGDRTADSITTSEIDERLFENVAPRGAGWTETTSNEYRVLLSHIYKLAIDRSQLAVNPAAKAHRYKLNNARWRELSYAEEDRLRRAICENYPDKEPEFDLALHTGVRRSNLYGIHGKGRREMAPLDWRNVDFDWKVLRLPRAKAGTGYTVPLNEVALRALKTLRERSDGTGPVIRDSSGRELHSCRKWFESSLEKASIEDFRFHDLRHTFASRLRRNGVPLEDVAALLDHGIPEMRMTLRYAHCDMERLHKAVATLVRTDTKTDTSPVVEFRRAEAV
jgi:integrase